MIQTEIYLINPYTWELVRARKPQITRVTGIDQWMQNLSPSNIDQQNCLILRLQLIVKSLGSHYLFYYPIKVKTKPIRVLR